jgi:hypothetical protein
VNGTHQLLVYTDDDTLLDENINTIKKNTNARRRLVQNSDSESQVHVSPGIHEA